ncbi:hypothetical protein ACNQKP_15170 [Bdellovibrio bacteriovorus]|uniref:hypothetical protein n=1 Tax=Bdellovibrio bacteriovorus TaxID=959 RepID=UPI003AA7BF3E
MLRKSGVFLTLTSSLILGAGCASNSAKTESPQSAEATAPGTTHYTVVNFQPGTNELSKEEQSKIHQLTEVAERHGGIQEVRILAWADREYPSPGQHVPAGDSKLADERAAAVKAVLKKDLQQIAVIDEHNSSLHPADTELNNAKASKALVLITYNTTTLNKGEHHE